LALPSTPSTNPVPGCARGPAQPLALQVPCKPTSNHQRSTVPQASRGMGRLGRLLPWLGPQPRSLVGPDQPERSRLTLSDPCAGRLGRLGRLPPRGAARSAAGSSRTVARDQRHPWPGITESAKAAAGSAAEAPGAGRERGAGSVPAAAPGRVAAALGRGRA
jgi:hypothetical protein